MGSKYTAYIHLKDIASSYSSHLHTLQIYRNINIVHLILDTMALKTVIKK